MPFNLLILNDTDIQYLLTLSTLNLNQFTPPINEGESAASFCWLVAALFPDMFFNIYVVKNHKIAKSSTNTKARYKISTDLESLKF